MDLGSVEQAVKKLRSFTVQDIAGQTGLPVFDSKRAVEVLMKKYRCQMQVTDRGELIYDFGQLMRRESKTWQEYLNELGGMLWKAFTAFFKAWIMLMLVGYFIVFMMLLLAVAIASLSARSDDRDRGMSLGGGIFALIFRIATEFFFWKTITGNLSYQRDRYGYRYRRYDPVTSELFKAKSDKKSKKFITAVFDYVFGPKRARIHPLENQREVATFIRKNNGIITIEEVRALAGWKGRKANEFFTAMVGNFEGEIKVSDKGVIYGEFTEFMSGKNTEESTDIVFFWDEFEPEYILNGNTGGQNLIITGMNLFVLLMAYAVFAGRFYLETQSELYLSLFLGWIPLVYACLFFLIPSVRFLLNSTHEKQRRLNNIRKRLMKAIFLDSGTAIPLPQLEASLNQSDEIWDRVDQKRIKQLMSEEIDDWKGELLVDDADGALVYDFTLLRESQAEAKRLRTGRRVDVTTGRTVFDTETG